MSKKLQGNQRMKKLSKLFKMITNFKNPFQTRASQISYNLIMNMNDQSIEALMIRICKNHNIQMSLTQRRKLSLMLTKTKQLFKNLQNYKIKSKNTNNYVRA